MDKDFLTLIERIESSIEALKTCIDNKLPSKEKSTVDANLETILTDVQVLKSAVFCPNTLAKCVVEVKEYPNKYGIHLNITVNGVNGITSFGLKSLPDAKELRSIDFYPLFRNYVLHHLESELEEISKQIIYDANYFASKKAKYGHTTKKDYKKRIKENEERNKKKLKEIGFDSRGKAKNDGIVLTLEKVNQVISSLPAKYKTQFNVVNKLGIELRTFNRWLKNNKLKWDALKEGKYIVT